MSPDTPATTALKPVPAAVGPEESDDLARQAVAQKIALHLMERKDEVEQN